MKHLTICTVVLFAIHSTLTAGNHTNDGASLAPVISVQPDSIILTLTVGDSTTRTLTIGNTGVDTLHWSIPRLGESVTASARSSRIEYVVAEMRASANVPVPSVRSMDGSKNHLASSNWTTEKSVNVFYPDSPTSAGLNIALVHGEFDNTDPFILDVQNKLMGTGAFNSITLVAARSVTPTLSQLFAYDAVMVWSNYSFASGTTLGNNLADYVDGGGGVVLTQFAMAPSDSTYLIGGRFTSGGYYAILPGSDLRNTQRTLGTVYQPLHAVMLGVTAFNGGSSSYHSNSLISAGAVRIADWSDGQPLVVEKTIGGHKRVDLGFWPVSSDAFSGGWVSSTDGAKMMAHALVYVSEPSFLTVTPDSGIVAPAGSSPIQVKINARYFSVGNYSQTIPVTSNDPVRPLKSVPVRMNVTPPVLSLVEFEVPLTISDGVDSMTMYFGILPTANICIVGDSYNGHIETLLPPLPPGGIYDTRLISPRAAQAATCYDQGSLVDFRPFISSAQLDTFRVKTQYGSGSTLTATWPSGLSAFFTSLKFRFFDGSGNVIVDMLTGTSVDFTLAGDPATINIFSGGLVVLAPGFDLNRTAIAFGSVHLLTPKLDSVTVTNHGSTPFDITSVTSDNPRFTATPSAATIPSLGSKNFYITFTPTALGAVNGKVIFRTNAILGQDTVLVSGTGVQGQFAVVPTSVSFDSVFVTENKKDSVLVRNTGTGILTMSSIASSNATEFSVTEKAPLLVQPNDSARIHITFHPTNAGVQTGFIRFTHDGSTLQDSIHVIGTGYITINVSVLLAANWNLISNPVTSPIPGDSMRQLFPTSVFPYAFEFSGGYVQRHRLENGKGYWGRFPAATTSTITGLPHTRDSIDVLAGWNMVGTISNPVDTSTIVSIPAGLRASPWFGFNGGYVPVTQLLPGQAYWVRSSAAGMFVLANPLVAGPAKVQPSEAKPLNEVLNSITITDSRGGMQTLYFGADANNSIPVMMYTMPPMPPVGAFDARFETSDGGSMVQTHAAQVADVVELPVTVQSEAYPLTITWKVTRGTASYEFADGREGNVFLAREMRGEGTMKITNSMVNRFSVKLVSDGQLPKQFALAQNFPNPFNPSTTIRYDLPKDSRVSLKLFDILGQEVAALVNEEQKAGYKSFVWNSNSVASGVYLYRLQAGDFVQTRKLLLLK